MFAVKRDVRHPTVNPHSHATMMSWGTRAYKDVFEYTLFLSFPHSCMRPRLLKVMSWIAKYHERRWHARLPPACPLSASMAPSPFPHDLPPSIGMTYTWSRRDTGVSVLDDIHVSEDTLIKPAM